MPQNMSEYEKDTVDGLKVLRVVQLDAAILDEEILHLLESQLKSVLKYFQTTTFRWQPELNLFLRAIIWKFTLYKNAATLGQSLFDVRYALNTNKGYSPITSKEKTVLGLLYVTSRWFQERIYDFLSVLGDGSSFSNKIRFCIKWIENVWRVASLVNFMVFLRNGIYPSLIDRVLGLQHLYNRPQSIKKASFNFMNREILWHGYAELIFFILPLMKLCGLKSALRRVLGKSTDGQRLESSPHAFSKSCPVCNGLPTQPYISNCGHQFCYYCIKTCSMIDSGYACPLCNATIRTFSLLQIRK